jgi:hypothetical protein
MPSTVSFTSRQKQTGGISLVILVFVFKLFFYTIFLLSTFFFLWSCSGIGFKLLSFLFFLFSPFCHELAMNLREGTFPQRGDFVIIESLGEVSELFFCDERWFLESV